MKHFLCCMISFFGWHTMGFAQSQFQWVKSAGGLGKHDQVRALGFDLQGNVYAAGNYNDTTRFDTVLLPVWSGTDAQGGSFLVKYNGSGQLIWAQSMRARTNITTRMCEISAMAVNPAGEATVFGRFTDSMTVSGQTIINPHNGFGENSSFIAKFDATGQLLWLKVIASRQSTVVEARILANDDILITGIFANSINFGNGMSLATGSTITNETFIARISSADGSCLWAVKPEAKKENRVSGLVADSDNAYITGVFRDSIRFNANTAFGVHSPESNVNNRRNLFVAAYNLQTGAFSWAQQIKGQLDWAADITVLNSGVVICGNATGYIKIGEDSSTAGAFVAGLNITNGNQIWLKKSSKFLNKLVRAGASEFFVLGNGPSGAWAIDTINTGYIGSGFMFAKMNAAGSALYAEVFGAGGATIGVADAAYQDGNLIVGGGCYGLGPVSLGNNVSLTIDELGYNNLWFGLFGGSGVGMSVHQLINPLRDIVVYPNPIRDGFAIKTAEEGLIQYELINLTGATLLKGNATSQEFINTNGLAAGTYFLRLKQNNQFISRKVVLTP